MTVHAFVVMLARPSLRFARLATLDAFLAFGMLAVGIRL